MIDVSGETMLTIHLPNAIRRELDQEVTTDRPLEGVVLDLIRVGLRHRTSIGEKVSRPLVREALQGTGLWEPLDETVWAPYLRDAEKVTHEEVREMLAGLSPLSEDIVAERNEGR